MLFLHFSRRSIIKDFPLKRKFYTKTSLPPFNECNNIFHIILYREGVNSHSILLCISGKNTMTSTELNALLTQHNITPREFAIRIGKSEALIKDWLAGRVKISKAYKKIIQDKVK